MGGPWLGELGRSRAGGASESPQGAYQELLEARGEFPTAWPRKGLDMGSLSSGILKFWDPEVLGS